MNTWYGKSSDDNCLINILDNRFNDFKTKEYSGFIFAKQGTVNISRTIFAHGAAGKFGSAFYFEGATFSIEKSEFSRFLSKQPKLTKFSMPQPNQSASRFR